MIRKILLSKRVHSASLAAGNMLCAIALLALPAVFSSSTEQILGLAVSLASVQAGQAAAVQTMGNLKLSKWVLITTLVSLLSAAVLFSSSGPLFDASVAQPVLLGLSGMLVGLKSGEHASRLLENQSPVKYQAFILKRNVLWVVAVLFCASLNAEWIVYGTALAWIATILSLKKLDRNNGTAQVAAIMGAVAALIYRNDINVARSMASNESFQAWHYTFIVYATVQALTGFLVINEVFSRREAIIGGLRPRHLVAIGIVVPLIACITWVLLLLELDRSPAFSMTLAILIFPVGVLVSVQAALAHVLSCSKTVYSAGLAGMAALLAAAAFGLNPAVGMSAELTVSGVIVGVGVIIRKNRSDPRTGNSKALLEKTL